MQTARNAIFIVQYACFAGRRTLCISIGSSSKDSNAISQDLHRNKAFHVGITYVKRAFSVGSWDSEPSKPVLSPSQRPL